MSVVVLFIYVSLFVFGASTSLVNQVYCLVVPNVMTYEQQRS